VTAIGMWGYTPVRTTGVLVLFYRSLSVVCFSTFFAVVSYTHIYVAHIYLYTEIVWCLRFSLHIFVRTTATADIFHFVSSAGWAIHICWSKCCLCVCLDVNRADTNRNRCTQTLV